MHNHQWFLYMFPPFSHHFFMFFSLLRIFLYCSFSALWFFCYHLIQKPHHSQLVHLALALPLNLLQSLALFALNQSKFFEAVCKFMIKPNSIKMKLKKITVKTLVVFEIKTVFFRLLRIKSGQKWRQSTAFN